jgi:acetylornithine deacetylase
MNPSDPADVRAAVGDPVALARALVRIPSVNPVLEEGGAGEREIANACAHWLTGWGLDVEVSEPAPGRFNVLARLGGGSPRLILNGHLDTVGVQGMPDPFGAEVREGRLYGRGACDMKGGVAAILAATARLAGEEAGAKPPDGLVVALTADEEHASLGMEALVRAGLHAEAAIVCEPTSLAVMPAHKGFVWIELTFRGRAAHGSRSEAGIDAIRHAGRFLVGLDGYEEALQGAPAHPLLGRGSVHAGTISGGSAPSVYPDSCRLVVERRTLPGETAEGVAAEIAEVLERVRSTHPEVDARLVTGLFRPGTEVPEDSPLVRGLLAAADACGGEPRLEPMTAWVDAAFLNGSGTPAVCFGPGSILEAHTADESVPLAEIEAAARVLERFARDFLATL